MSPMRPRSSSASSTLPPPPTGKEKPTKPAAGAHKPPKRSRRSSFACKMCGKRFPSQQAMAGHCSGHTRTASGAARRTAAARQQLLLPYPASSSSPLPLPIVVTVQLAVLFWPLLTRVQLSLPLPPSQIGWWPPGSFFPKSSLLSPTTVKPASAMVDVTLRLGSGGKSAHEKRTLVPLVESPMVPNHCRHRGEHEQGRDGKRERVMDCGDHARKKGKGQMDGLDLELRLHR